MSKPSHKIGNGYILAVLAMYCLFLVVIGVAFADAVVGIWHFIKNLSSLI